MKKYLLTLIVVFLSSFSLFLLPDFVFAGETPAQTLIYIKDNNNTNIIGAPVYFKSGIAPSNDNGWLTIPGATNARCLQERCWEDRNGDGIKEYKVPGCWQRAFMQYQIYPNQIGDSPHAQMWELGPGKPVINPPTLFQTLSALDFRASSGHVDQYNGTFGGGISAIDFNLPQNWGFGFNCACGPLRVTIDLSSQLKPNGSANPLYGKVIKSARYYYPPRSLSTDHAPGISDITWSCQNNICDFYLPINNSNTTGLEVTIGPKPTCNLTASNASPICESTFNLNWTSQNATSASIDNLIGAVGLNGTTSRQAPTTNTTYTMTLNGSPSYTCPTTVNACTVVPLTCSISASPNPVSQLFPSLITWSTNGTSATIDQGVNTGNAPTGSRTVNVRDAGVKTYTMTATKGSETKTCSTPLTVNPNTDSSGGTSAP